MLIANDDLLCRYLRTLSRKNDLPDEFSMEWDEEDNPLILLRWDNGREKEVPYTASRYGLALDTFNTCWRGRVAS